MQKYKTKFEGVEMKGEGLKNFKRMQWKMYYKRYLLKLKNSKLQRSRNLIKKIVFPELIRHPNFPIKKSKQLKFKL